MYTLFWFFHHQNMPFCKNGIVINYGWNFGSYTSRWSAELLIRTHWRRFSEAGLLYVYVTLTHGKRLSYSNSAVFDDTVVPFRFHWTIIRWLNDVIARFSQSRAAFLKQSGIFLFPRFFFVRRNMPDGTDNYMKERWRKRDLTWCLHHCLTNDKIDKRIQHENEPSGGLPAIFWHAKNFATAHEVAARACENPPAIRRWLKMSSRMARCFHDQSRIWKFPLSRFHLVSISRQCDSCINIAFIFFYLFFIFTFSPFDHKLKAI